MAHGAGAIGNRTIGASALGGMLFGTIFGVIIVPGLYFIFGSLADGRKLIKFEEESSLSEGFVSMVKSDVEERFDKDFIDEEEADK